MRFNRLLYALHRWVALVILAQLLLWVLTGAFFTLVSHGQLHGVRHDHQAPPLALDGPVLAPDEVLRRLASRGVRDVTALELRPGDAGPFWVVTRAEGALRVRAADAGDAPVGRDEAVRVARADQGGAAVVDVRLYTASPPLEYRKKPLPAWRVELADGAGTAVWVDATRGAVVTRRNRVWRVYDFLWSLHIMDYWGRDDFHTPWMVAAAALALATVVSGAVIWGVRARRRWGRRDGPRPAAAAPPGDRTSGSFRKSSAGP